MTDVDEFLTLSQIEKIAEEKLPLTIWDYAAGGAGVEITLERNRRALARLALEQHVLVDVRELSIKTTLFGVELPSPIIVAPMGGLKNVHPEGDLEMARGAGATGNLACVTGVTAWPMEQVAAEARGPLMFQLYHHGPREWVGPRLERVVRSGYRAVALTVDSAMYSRRERDVLKNYSGRDHTAGIEPRGPDSSYPQRLTWDDVDWLREQLPIPFGLKGVMHPDDALQALDHGVDFIWVSNHGGRQIDDGRASVDALAEIATVLQGRIPLIVDGGFRRGSDVLKAVALGASGVAMGRGALWGLAAGGAAGVQRTLELLHTEMRINLGLTGRVSLAQLSPRDVRKVDY